MLHVTALNTVGGEFLGQYSDESTPRMIGHPGDYVYPSDLRINPDRSTLFAKASGLAGGISPVTVLFEFDLQNRSIRHTYLVDGQLLGKGPEPPPPTP